MELGPLCFDSLLASEMEVIFALQVAEVVLSPQLCQEILTGTLEQGARQDLLTSRGYSYNLFWM